MTLSAWLTLAVPYRVRVTYLPGSRDPNVRPAPVIVDLLGERVARMRSEGSAL